MEVQEALEHLDNCKIDSRKRWKKNIERVKGKDPLDKLSEEEKELVRAVRKTGEGRGWRQVTGTLRWEPIRIAKYTIYLDPCPKCLKAMETLRSNSMEYLRLTDGWAEEKFEEITGKSLQEK